MGMDPKFRPDGPNIKKTISSINHLIIGLPNDLTHAQISNSQLTERFRGSAK